MSTTRKLRRQRDVARGTEYARLLDEWITAPSRFSGDVRPITALYDALVEHGRHKVTTEPSQPGGES